MRVMVDGIGCSSVIAKRQSRRSVTQPPFLPLFLSLSLVGLQIRDTDSFFGLFLPSSLKLSSLLFTLDTIIQLSHVEGHALSCSSCVDQDRRGTVVAAVHTLDPHRSGSFQSRIKAWKNWLDAVGCPPSPRCPVTPTFSLLWRNRAKP